MSHYSRQIRDCLHRLGECSDVCLSMVFTDSLEAGGEQSRPQHLRLMYDCAAFCALTRAALLRKSQFHASILALCADICDTCAEDCAALNQMDNCVAACRACADACRVAARLDHAELLHMAERLPPT